MCPVITLNAKTAQNLRPHIELQMITPQTNPFSRLLLDYMDKNPMLSEHNVGLPYKEIV
jgi:hypothetical protein